MQETNNHNPDVDLDAVKRRLKSYASGINDSIFDVILFIKRYIIIIAVLFIGGAALGFYLDSGEKMYHHKIFVTPNFESVDYLYEQIDRIESKIKEGDSVYIKSLGIKMPEHLAKIEIEPVVDIYEFIDKNRPDQNNNNKIDLFKILSENGETSKIIEDKVTSRNYKNHIITISTVSKTNEADLITPLLKTFNSNSYWLEAQKVYLENLAAKTAENERMIEQINKLLGDYGGAQKNATGVAFYNDNTNIADLFNLKGMYTRELGTNRLNKIDYDKIVKDRAILLNIKAKDFVGSNMKLILPVVLLLIFTAIIKFRDYYRYQIKKRKSA